MKLVKNKVMVLSLSGIEQLHMDGDATHILKPTFAVQWEILKLHK